MIDNTSYGRARDLFVLQSLLGADPSDLIDAQEARGQQQLLTSDRLPTELRGERAEWEGLGFTFGEPDPADPLFMPATLPNGWSKQASDSTLWTHISDQFGRRRVSILYKAALYDRHAFASLITVYQYVYTATYYGKPIVTDDAWATPQAVLAAAEELIREAERRMELFAGNADELAEAGSLRATYQAIADSVRPA